MTMKIICPNCRKVISVSKSSEGKNVFCSKCGINFPYESGYKLAKELYRDYQKRAYNACYNKMDYQESYNLYEECLSLVSNDLSSIVGMCLSKIYGQTFDNLEFNNVIEILNKYDIVLDSTNTYIFLEFVIYVLDQCDNFINQVENRLMYQKEIFYNNTYFSYYKEGILQIEKLLNFFNDSFSLCKKEEFDIFTQENTSFLNRFNDFLSSIETLKKSNFKVNGVGVINFENKLIENIDFNIEDIELDDLRVAIPNTDKIRTIYIFGGIIVGFLLIAAILFLVGISIKNNILLYCSLIPLAIAGIFFFVFYKKSRKNNS